MRGFSQFFVLAACSTASQAGLAYVGGHSHGGLTDPEFARGAPSVVSHSGGLSDPSFNRAQVGAQRDVPTFSRDVGSSVSGGLADPSYHRPIAQGSSSVSGGLADPSYHRPIAQGVSPVASNVSSNADVHSNAGGLASPTFTRASVSSGKPRPAGPSGRVAHAPNLQAFVGASASSGSDVTENKPVLGLSNPSFVRGQSAGVRAGAPAGGSRGPAAALTHAPLTFKSGGSVSSESSVPAPVGGARGAAHVGFSEPLTFKRSGSVSSETSVPPPVGGARGAAHVGFSEPLRFKSPSLETGISGAGVGGARGPAVQSPPLKFKSELTDRIEIPMSKAGTVIEGPSVGSLRGTASYVPESDRIYEARTKPSAFKSLYNKVFGTEKAYQRAFQNRLSKPDWSIH